MMNINIHIFIAIFLILKYCIDGLFVVINFRNMKLLINTGRCVQTDRKRCFQTQHKLNGKYSIKFHTLNFIVLNILMGIGYIMEC